jgi:hypothetical protein
MRTIVDFMFYGVKNEATIMMEPFCFLGAFEMV